MYMGEQLDISLQRDKIRHKEVTGLLKDVKTALNSIPKEDNELKKLLSQNREAISNFAEAVNGLKNQGKQELKVETNQDKVVDALKTFSVQMADIMSGIDKRLAALENMKQPITLKVKRGGYQGTGLINEITIEYNK